MTQLLPGGGVPRIHRAWSPVPPRCPHFARPRSVRYLATVVAGAYPLRRPPNVWSPGLLAPPGPCYWLVASGTPMGWSRGRLAVGLVRSAVRHYCLSGRSALLVCARRSLQVGRAGPVPLLVAPPPCCPSLASLAVLVAGCRVRVFLVLPCWYAIPCGLCVPRAQSRCSHGPRSVFVVCLFAGASAVVASPLLPLPFARAPREVPLQDAGRAVPGGSCPSVFPARVPCSACCWWGGGGGGPAPASAFLFPGGVWGVSGVGNSPYPDRLSLGQAVGARCPLSFGGGCGGVGTRHQTHSARSCEPAVRAVGAARGRPGEILLPRCGASGLGCSPSASRPYMGQAAGNRYPFSVGTGECGRGDPSPTPQRALLRAGFARCGRCTWVPGGGAPLASVGCPGLGALPPPAARPWGRRRGPAARFP